MTTHKISSMFRLGVRQKVVLVLLTMLFISLSISAWMAFNQEKASNLKEINQRGQDITRFVAKSVSFGVVGYDYHAIQLLLDEIVTAEEIGYAKVLSAKGNVMAESGSIGDNPADIVMFEREIKVGNDVVGRLVLGITTKKTIQRIESQKYTLIKRETFIILMIILAEFLALSYIIIRPVGIMSRSLDNSVDENGRILGKIPVMSNDEFGRLAQRFNSLSEQLNQANARLKEKVDLSDQKLVESNKQLLKQSEELRRVSEEFRKMSITDVLTGLYNRRHFEDLMKREMELAERYNDVNSLLVIDIDHFKKINDSYGHPCGDIVLRELAKTLRQKLRKNDILCRLGGEEFVALCKRADKASAIKIAEHLREEIENRLLNIGVATLTVTISIGVATSGRDGVGNSADDLYRFADQSMFFSKENGRNRVTHYSEIVNEKNLGNKRSG